MSNPCYKYHHRKEPRKYTHCLAWMDRMDAKGFKQKRCPVCKLWKIWVKP